MASAMDYVKASGHAELGYPDVHVAGSVSKTGDARLGWSARRAVSFAVLTSAVLWGAIVYTGIAIFQTVG